MTTAQKRNLADALYDAAQMLIERIGDNSGYYNEIQDIDPQEATDQIAKWLRHLPQRAATRRTSNLCITPP